MSISSVSASSPALSNLSNPSPAASKQPASTADQAPPQADTQSSTPPVAQTSSALQEATETAAQTAQEARHGDRQAQRLVQKAAAHHHPTAPQKANTPVPSAPPTVNANGQLTGTIVNTKV
ncbi:hypothetical protein OL229_07890 [Neisseriaceae bacterium JH1-16]|nr:hypothetical protein [Neisseriaceae bacterium JH1-16]